VAITGIERSDDRILSFLPVRCLVHTKGNLRDLMAVVQIDRALALWRLATADSLGRRCAVTTLHVDVLLVCEVNLGVGRRDCDGCHDCGGKGVQNGMGLEEIVRFWGLRYGVDDGEMWRWVMCGTRNISPGPKT